MPIFQYPRYPVFLNVHIYSLLPGPSRPLFHPPFISLMRSPRSQTSPCILPTPVEGGEALHRCPQSYLRKSDRRATFYPWGIGRSQHAVVDDELLLYEGRWILVPHHHHSGALRDVHPVLDGQALLIAVGRGFVGAKEWRQLAAPSPYRMVYSTSPHVT